MQYIIMDLEWNNVWEKKRHGYINEIIEIGAVKLDDTMQQVDTFSMFVQSAIGKKLRHSVKELTKITSADLRDAAHFPAVLRQFQDWLGPQPHILLSWGDGDIRVLLDNYRYFYPEQSPQFLQKYMDLQAYVQSRIKKDDKNQIGLLAAAELLGIPVAELELHRALGDSLLGAECLRLVFAEEAMWPYVKNCDAEFYRRLSFKNYVIKNINNPKVDQEKLKYVICRNCGSTHLTQTKAWKYSNQYFRAEFFCEECKKLARISVGFRQLFDRLEVRRRFAFIEEKPDVEAVQEVPQ